MGSSQQHINSGFVLLAPRLILVPTPLAVSDPPYRRLYASLHRDEAFCQMAFGEHFPAVDWSDEQTREVIETRDIARSWRVRSIGDFAVGLRPSENSVFWKHKPKERQLPTQNGSFSIIEDDAFASDDCRFLQGVEWVGYAGVRDATTTSLRKRAQDEPQLPPWEDMVEIRYGVAPAYWGQGIATSAAEAVMQWAVAERGVRRFIAETERDNVRSAGVLKKMGFSLSGTDYFEEPSEVEWERRFMNPV